MNYADPEDRRRYMREYYRRTRISKGIAKVWFGDRWARAQALRLQGLDDAAIGVALGLTEKQVSQKFYNEGYHANASRTHKAEQAVLDARDALFASPRTLTESICGDPLPGRSALDKKRVGPSR